MSATFSASSSTTIANVIDLAVAAVLRQLSNAPASALNASALNSSTTENAPIATTENAPIATTENTPIATENVEPDAIETLTSQLSLMKNDNRLILSIDKYTLSRVIQVLKADEINRTSARERSRKKNPDVKIQSTRIKPVVIKPIVIL